LHRQTDNLAALMARADLAVGAGGGAMWERCCLGLPSIVISIADNQVPGCTALARRGLCWYLGASAQVTPALLSVMLQAARAIPAALQHMAAGVAQLVDGAGAARVCARLLQAETGSRLALRPASPADMEPAYRWRNADAVRRYSGNDALIGYDRHCAWFASVLADPQRRLVIGEIDGRPAGVLRYDRAGDTATVSIYLTPEFLGQGIGAALIARGSAWIAGQWPDLRAIEARIRPDNAASSAAFEAAGYGRHYSLYIQPLEA
jgi:UDP-2,4-diacetamido-2,4,6-trideoxy-beta-L-altropyranose hydrolase